MYIRIMNSKQHEAVTQYLITQAKLVENSISYDVPITVNGIIYLLRIQPEKGRRIAVLQTVRRSAFGEYEVLRDNPYLSALTEVLIYQICREKGNQNG